MAQCSGAFRLIPRELSVRSPKAPSLPSQVRPELGCARGRCACLLVCVAFENGRIKTAGLHGNPCGIDARSRASGSIHDNGASPNGDGSVSTTVDTVGVVKGGELMRLATGPFDHRRCLDFQIAVIQLHGRDLVAGIHGPGVTLEFARGRRKRLVGMIDEHAAVVEDGHSPASRRPRRHRASRAACNPGDL